MKRLVFLLPLALSACTPSLTTAGSVIASGADAAGASAPVTYADKSTLDEKGAIAAEKAFTLAAKAAALGIRSGLISDRATLVRIDDLRAKAYTKLLLIRAAYRAGNATSYAGAFREFVTIITELNTLF